MALGYSLYLMTTFTFKPLCLIFHGFTEPNCFNYRHAFIFVFFMICLAIRSYNKLDYNKKNYKYAKYILIILSVLILVARFKFNVTTYNLSILVSVLFGLLYFYFLNKNKKIVIYIAIFDVLINTISYTTMLKLSDKQYMSDYKNYVKDVSEVLESIKDDSFYRIEKEYSYTTNDPLLLNYNGISHYSSTFEQKNNKLLGDYLGIFNRYYVTNYLGSTPVTNSLFRIKYVLLNHKADYYDLIDTVDDIYIYSNKYYLPLGFMVNNKLENLQLQLLEPFANQNNILKAMSGTDKDVFERNVVSDVVMYNVKEDEKSAENYRKVDGALEEYRPVV